MLLAVRIGATRLIDNLYVDAQPPIETAPTKAQPTTEAQPRTEVQPVAGMESRDAAAVCEL
jgi:hypothetical protein